MGPHELSDTVSESLDLIVSLKADKLELRAGRCEFLGSQWETEF